MSLKELKEIWNNRSWRFCIWFTAALLAYRTAPDAEFLPWLTVPAEILYLVLWGLLVELDARVGREKISPLMKFIGFLAAAAGLTLVAGSGGVLGKLASLWLVPVGLPLQGLVRLVNDAASRSDASLARISLVFCLVMLALRVGLGAIFRARERKKS